MKINYFKSEFVNRLSEIYDKEESESFFFMILKNLKNLTRIDVALNPDLEFSEKEIQQIEHYLSELQKSKPIQYLLEKTEFYGLEFQVNENVLIPRPETEELVDWIIKENQSRKGISILDIGTGSGAIAVSLSKNLNSEVFAFDISEEALSVAQTNSDSNQTFVHFIEFDILNDIWEGEKFDIIVSNPPYVRELEKKEIKANVLDFEPHLALFIPDEDPLLFYKKIADFALEHLVENGQLYFEINQYLGNETVKMLSDKGFKNIQLKKDIYQNDRMILAYK